MESYRYYLYKIRTFPKDVWRGIKNIIRWTPIIWDDQDWDWAYLSDIMEYKLRRMSKQFRKDSSWCYGANRDSRDTLICAELLKRIRTDDDSRVNIRIHVARMKSWNKMLGDIIGKRLQYWWD
jgi:hypothetical protein